MWGDCIVTVNVAFGCIRISVSVFIEVRPHQSPTILFSFGIATFFPPTPPTLRIYDGGLVILRITWPDKNHSFFVLGYRQPKGNRLWSINNIPYVLLRLLIDGRPSICVVLS